MTTSVYDCDNAIAASDTRWSATIKLPDGEYIIHVDDTGFNKIVARKGGIIVCAGDGKTIEKLKKWWSSDVLIPDNMPNLEESGKFSVGMLMISSNGEIVHDSGMKRIILNPQTRHIHAIFLGSGGKAASDVFFGCGCAKSSVEWAKNVDPWSGGEVKYIELNSWDNNLQDENLDYYSIIESMKKRGVMMKVDNYYFAGSPEINAIDLSDHPQADEIKSWLANGSVKAYSPMGAEKQDWSEEQNAKIIKAAKKIAELEKLITN
nr:hypothetical protein [Providencia sp. PROV266]